MLWPRPGLCQALQYVLRAKPNAMVVGGPPCSSFVWINSATSKRSADNPFGDTDRQYVRSSNKLLILIWLNSIYSQQLVNVTSSLKIGLINIFFTLSSISKVDFTLDVAAPSLRGKIPVYTDGTAFEFHNASFSVFEVRCFCHAKTGNLLGEDLPVSWLHMACSKFLWC